MLKTNTFINTLENIQHHLTQFRKQDRRVLATSSFQTQSVPLLHILGTHFPEVEIIFLDTGFLFTETYAFKKELEQKINLNVVELRSNIDKHQQIESDTGLFWYALDPDRCCEMNKVQPLEDYLKEGDVWISGVRRDQSKTRQQKTEFEAGPKGSTRFHPMLNWTQKDIYDYINRHDLPKHPLEAEGYASIGCVPCTNKWCDGPERDGRWEGQNKTECGLHN